MARSKAIVAAKTGMLLNAVTVEVVAQKMRQYGVMNLVVDPVMVSTSGAQLLTANAIDVFRRSLLPLALLVTPNIEEARSLTGRNIQTLEDMEEAALQIHGMGARHVLIKGGHLQGDEATDVLFDGQEFKHFSSGRIAVRDTHGTGCVLSAAITAYLAKGSSVHEAVQLGRQGTRVHVMRDPDHHGLVVHPLVQFNQELVAFLRVEFAVDARD